MPRPADNRLATGHATLAEIGPVMLVRYRQGVIGETFRTVHVVMQPTLGQAKALCALCDAVLMPGDLESVAPGEGMPCTACLLRFATLTAQPPAEAPNPADTAEPAPSGVTYQQWGWPVTLRSDQVRLSLDHGVSALMIPAVLSAKVTPVLIQRRCAPPVLAHPYAPEHHIVLTGEKYGLPLPWPEQAHEVTGVLLLPPTHTSRGPITWIKTPHPDSLKLCREIDLFAALRSIGDGDAPSPGG